MTNLTINRPEAAEYAPYYGKYISLVPERDVLVSLAQQLDETLALLASISEAQADYRYAPDKWSIKQLLGHLIDTERIFGYRALRFARNDDTPLSGFEQDEYVSHASFDEYALADLASEFEHVRRSNLLLFKHLSAEAWGRTGKASDSEVSVRALAYIIAGHELHHVEILRNRYLPSSVDNSTPQP
jgi:uncharacterized damage-inducible protein DinB